MERIYFGVSLITLFLLTDSKSQAPVGAGPTRVIYWDRTRDSGYPISMEGAGRDPRDPLVKNSF